MKLKKTPATRLAIEYPEKIEGTGRHIRVNVEGDDLTLALTNSRMGAMGYVFTRENFKQMVEEMQEVVSSLDES